MKLNLSKKLNLFGVLIVAVPLMIVSAVLIRQAGQTIDAAHTDRAQFVAVSLTQTIREGLNGLLTTGNSLAGTPGLVALAETVHKNGIEPSRPAINAFNPTLHPVIQGLGPNFSGLWLASTDGFIYGGIKPDGDVTKYTHLDIRERGYYQRLMKTGETVISEALYGKSTGRAIVIVAAPVRSGEETVGILGLSVNLDFLTDLVTRKRIGKTGYCFMVNADGLAIAHPDPDTIMKFNITTLDGLEGMDARMSEGRAGSFEYTYQEAEKIGFFAPVPDKEWYIVATIDKKELLGPARKMRNTAIYFTLGFLVLAILLVYYLSRTLSNPIIGSIGRLADISRHVSGASGQFADNSHSLAEVSNQQAASLEESASTLEEMSAMIQQNAQNSDEANAIVKAARETLNTSTAAIDRLTASMGEIDTASEKTAQIIHTIDEIAFQTNLLALNAAVEAARAGEAGAGFGVVAEEVKNLAGRATQAAKNTAALIDGTLRKVKEGTNTTNEATASFEELVRHTRKVSELMDEIAAASNEQARGIQQITTAMAEIEKVTHEHAASSQLSASASEALNEQTEQMRVIVRELSGVVGKKNGRHPLSAVPRNGRKQLDYRRGDFEAL